MKKPIPFGKYYLLDRISVGGMAEVFKAKAFGVEGFERLIAVKRILPSIAEDEEFITMFIDEAKIAVQLTHANIAQIFDLGKVGDSYFIALEYVAGRDMRAFFDRMRKDRRTIPIPMAVYVTMKVCEGLDYAHNKKDVAGRDLNLVHRDVSPQNVLISYDGEVKIIDFGIAKAAGKAGKTQAGILKGKFGYMSPEQVRGLPLDRRSDIFGVGICLWEIVTGERLFMGESDFSTLEKVRNVEISPPSNYNKRIPEDLERIILKSLSKEVEDRYQSAMDFHDDLQSWMYTSGNFFARKDLAAFTQEAFRDTLEKETNENDGLADLGRNTVPPPPRTSRPGESRSAARAGAMPSPPKVTQPPPPPPSSSTGPSLPRPTGTGTAPSAQKPAIPKPAKRTMLGMPAAQMQTGSGSAQSAIDTQKGHAAQPIQANNNGLTMDDWDEEDEPPTNIYSKQTAGEMARAAIAAANQSSMSAANKARTMEIPAPMPIEPPAPSGMPVTAPSDFENGIQRRKKGSFMGVILGISVTLLILAAIFFGLKIFVIDAAKGGLELKVDPGDQLQIVLNGTVPLSETKSPVDIPGLAAGTHSIRITRKGYKPKEISFNVKKGMISSKQLTLDKISTGFYLDTIPAGASVWINDRPIEDKTPCTITDLKAGKHSVRVTKGDDFRQLNLEVDVVDGEITKLPQKELSRESIELVIKSQPPAEIVLRSGHKKEKLGMSPVSKTVDTDKTYKIEYSLNKYKKVVKEISEEDLNTSKEKLEIELVKLERTGGGSSTRPPPRRPDRTTTSNGGEPGKLSVQTRPWSRVLINGRFIRNTPLVNHQLKPGSYTVTVENPSFNIKKKFQVRIHSGKTTTVVRNLMPN